MRKWVRKRLKKSSKNGPKMFDKVVKKWKEKQLK